MKNFITLVICLLLFPTSFAETLVTEPNQGRLPILSAIQQAKHSIHLIMYGFTDKILAKALIDAKENGKDVQVLLEAAPYKAPQENKTITKLLKQAHIPIHHLKTNTTNDPQFKPLLHQKTLIIDHQFAMVMTFNFTHSTFSHERNFALIIDKPQLVDLIDQHFRADWQGNDFHHPSSVLVYSPEDSRHTFLNLLASARSQIKMYAASLSDYQIIGALAQAAKRGIKVQILTSLPPNQFFGRKVGFLRKANIEIAQRQHLMIHAKAIIIDQKRAIIGSTNLTKASLDHNRELSIVTQNPTILTALLQTFNRDWQAKTAP